MKYGEQTVPSVLLVSALLLFFFFLRTSRTSVDSGQWERRQSLALDLPLLLQAPLGLQDRVLKLSPSIDVAGRRVIEHHQCEKGKLHNGIISVVTSN